MASITFEELVNDGNTDWEGLLDRVGDGPMWDALENGEYVVEVVKAEPSHNSHHLAQWEISMRVIEGPERGHPVWTRVVLDDSNKNNTAVFFRISNCLGIPLAFYDTHPTDEQVAEEMVGRKAIVTVHEHRVDGTYVPRVTGFKRHY